MIKENILDQALFDEQDHTSQQESDKQASPRELKKGIGVILFQHDHFKGSKAQFPLGKYDLNSFKKFGANNDDISSMVVLKGFRARLYQHGNFKGWHAAFEKGHYNMQDIIERGAKNDDASSLIVERNFCDDDDDCAGNFECGYEEAGSDTKVCCEEVNLFGWYYFCYDLSHGQKCHTQAMCGSGLYCGSNCYGGQCYDDTCQSKRKGGWTCKYNDQCESGWCYKGFNPPYKCVHG